MRLAIAILVASLVILSGCAVKETTDATDLAAQDTTAEEVTSEQTATETDALLLEEDEELDIGEML